jgi:hypothetical protein
MHVQSVTATLANSIATAKVIIQDSQSKAVAGATVTGTWSGAVTGTASAITDSAGQVQFSKRAKKNASVSFTVTNVAKSGYTYNSAANVVTKVTTQ